MLPGDEITEKKHANIKMLTAQMESADLSKRATRKWPGLGPSVFEVDYAALFEEYKDLKKEAEGEGQPPAAEPDNEISAVGAAATVCFRVIAATKQSENCIEQNMVFH